jgi:hypothetical protein
VRTQLYKALHKISAWQMRIIALASLVVLVGTSSQFLANAFASGVGPEIPVQQVAPVVTQVPTSTTYFKHHIIIRHAGIDTLGGYTVTLNH